MAPRLFGFIESYALMLGLGIFAALFLFEFYFRKVLKVPSGKMFYLEIPLLVAIAVGLAGAYLTQNLYDFIQDPAHYSWNWSLTFYGGLLFGVPTFLLLYFLWGKKHYPNGLWTILLVAPSSIALAHGLGRIGCFLGGCCYGRHTDAWYGVHFETTADKVIPTNLFEAIFLLLLFGILLFLLLKWKTPFGMPIYMISYGIWRFLIEYIRDDYRGSFIPGLTPSQFWSILAVVFGIIYIIVLVLMKKKDRFPKEVNDGTI